MTRAERTIQFEHGLIEQALAHAVLRAENLRLRSQLREAIAKVVALESRLKATAVNPQRRPAGRADCSTQKDFEVARRVS